MTFYTTVIGPVPIIMLLNTVQMKLQLKLFPLVVLVLIHFLTGSLKQKNTKSEERLFTQYYKEEGPEVMHDILFYFGKLMKSAVNSGSRSSLYQ
jgi:hypothetical protein